MIKKKITFKRLIEWLYRIDRYPIYLYDIYCNTYAKRRLHNRGILLGNGIWFNGMPIIKNIAGGEISIGRNCLLCSRSRNTALGVNHPVIIRTMQKGANINIGNNARMSGVSICAANRIIISDNAVIGANTMIIDTDFHSMDMNKRNSTDRKVDLHNAFSVPIEIDSDVFIGANCSILKGVQIGCGAVIGIGSVVTKNIPPFSIVAGNPARIIGNVNKK